MENYKVRVSNESESKEAQELFLELGYKFSMVGFCKDYNSCQVFSDVSGSLFGDHDTCSNKELTLPELRGLVVLKRNDVGDATHINTRTNTPYLKQGDNEYYMHNGTWFLSDCPNDLKPITNSGTMKEYLNEKYELITSKEELSNLIKVPEGAEIAYTYGDNTYFAKPVNDGDGVLMWILGEDTQWDTTGWNSWQSLINTGLELLWQRSKPKEYLDPEDGYSLVTAVHALPNWVEVPEGADECIVQEKTLFFYKNDNMYFIDGKWVECNKCYQKASEFLMTSFNAERVWQRNAPAQPEALPFIDDEVKDNSVNDTLLERQQQYGCFEDVAHVTQEILKALRSTGGYDRMPPPHKESLHMIASKMARIVNGDCNHKDSWHDIGGYAKLIENLIGDTEDDMPF